MRPLAWDPGHSLIAEITRPTIVYVLNPFTVCNGAEGVKASLHQYRRFVFIRFAGTSRAHISALCVPVSRYPSVPMHMLQQNGMRLITWSVRSGDVSDHHLGRNTIMPSLSLAK